MAWHGMARVGRGGAWAVAVVVAVAVGGWVGGGGGNVPRPLGFLPHAYTAKHGQATAVCALGDPSTPPPRPFDPQPAAPGPALPFAPRLDPLPCACACVCVCVRVCVPHACVAGWRGRGRWGGAGQRRGVREGVWVWRKHYTRERDGGCPGLSANGCAGVGGLRREPARPRWRRCGSTGRCGRPWSARSPRCRTPFAKTPPPLCVCVCVCACVCGGPTGPLGGAGADGGRRAAARGAGGGAGGGVGGGGAEEGTCTASLEAVRVHRSMRSPLERTFTAMPHTSSPSTNCSPMQASTCGRPGRG
jgi:hypothetical protein